MEDWSKSIEVELATAEREMPTEEELDALTNKLEEEANQ